MDRLIIVAGAFGMVLGSALTVLVGIPWISGKPLT